LLDCRPRWENLSVMRFKTDMMMMMGRGECGECGERKSVFGRWSSGQAGVFQTRMVYTTRMSERVGEESVEGCGRAESLGASDRSMFRSRADHRVREPASELLPLPDKHAGGELGPWLASSSPRSLFLTRLSPCTLSRHSHDPQRAGATYSFAGTLRKTWHLGEKNG
jgi:hypothetical protein